MFAQQRSSESLESDSQQEQKKTSMFSKQLSEAEETSELSENGLKVRALHDSFDETLEKFLTLAKRTDTGLMTVEDVLESHKLVRGLGDITLKLLEHFRPEKYEELSKKMQELNLIYHLALEDNEDLKHNLTLEGDEKWIDEKVMKVEDIALEMLKNHYSKEKFNKFSEYEKIENTFEFHAYYTRCCNAIMEATQASFGVESNGKGEKIDHLLEEFKIRYERKVKKNSSQPSVPASSDSNNADAGAGNSEQSETKDIVAKIDLYTEERYQEVSPDQVVPDLQHLIKKGSKGVQSWRLFPHDP